ncbi:hypothetical protein BDV30DRAFT_202693 [Aspergillus minisclerotigenes]|uniref:Uncharacterized protein n=1 Tax=Aspergillus minisclerotigenes TaxID=656917 RepID=A0A5N6JIV2_9EURO|nr:hypothetical protein BDV30DRAFT_202693 [Aspergillus minisclerotigenes]
MPNGPVLKLNEGGSMAEALAQAAASFLGQEAMSLTLEVSIRLRSIFSWKGSKRVSEMRPSHQNPTSLQLIHRLCLDAKACNEVGQRLPCKIDLATILHLKQIGLTRPVKSILSPKTKSRPLRLSSGTTTLIKGFLNLQKPLWIHLLTMVAYQAQWILGEVRRSFRRTPTSHIMQSKTPMPIQRL